MTRIAYVTPEVLPFSKTGGLGDVSASLPRALMDDATQVVVFSPLYASARTFIERHSLSCQHQRLPHELWIGDERYEAAYCSLQLDGVHHVLVDNPAYYDRDTLYLESDGTDFCDNVSRFAYFCRAVLEYHLHIAPPPDIYHVQDWQCSLIPIYLKTAFARPELSRTRSLLTIHNLGYQGLFPAQQIYCTGLGWELFTPERLEYYGQLNLLKGGVLFADAVNTVSPTYAQEIQTAEHGRGLDGVIRSCRAKVSGILNGIDTRVWDPACDPHLPAHYSAAKLSGKMHCKKALQLALGLPVRPKAMLLGVISRLDPQKGTELIIEALPRLAPLDIQLVILGSGEARAVSELRQLARAFPEQLALYIGYDEPLAHLIEAGADAFLMPSLYEPCGLNQMYSQRYGTLPIVRETGGLKDTVLNYTPHRLAANAASGFTFRAYDSRRLGEAARRAAALYFANRPAWNKLVKHVMGIDHSWSQRATQYRALYHRLRADRNSPATAIEGGAGSE